MGRNWAVGTEAAVRTGRCGDSEIGDTLGRDLGPIIMLNLVDQMIIIEL